jgi:hypothetical protein
MNRNCVTAVLLGTALLLGGCDFADSALLPSLSGSSADSSSGSAPAVAATSPGPQLGTGNFKPEPVAPLKPTGTPVGQKVEALRNDLIKLQGSIVAENSTLQSLRGETVKNVQTYNQAVAAINAKLDVGTTPGNPILVKQWTDAQSQLEKGNSTLAAMNKLSTDVAASASMSNFLLASTRSTFALSGAVDEDHAQLQVLEDEVNKTTILIDRLLSELTEDINRQTYYLAEQRGYVNTLAVAVNNGEALGSSLASRVYAPPMAPAMAPGAGMATGRPLVVIRFDRPNPDYQQALYQAVSQVLARRPNAAFDLVAVAPQTGGAAQVALNSNVAQRDADQVMRSLMSMGLGADRVSQSAATSPTAQVNEVHLYVR